MSTFGRQQLLTVGHGVKLGADGRPEFKHGGVSIDWTTVAAVAGADVTLPDGFTVLIGEKYLRYGQVVTKITASGKYGPYDPAAADGRQTLASGSAFILNETVKENDLHSDHPPVIDGGKVWKARLIQSELAAHTLALGPTLAELLALFPRLSLVVENP
jgi:hypothetical protein